MAHGYVLMGTSPLCGETKRRRRRLSDSLFARGAFAGGQKLPEAIVLLDD